LRVTSDSLLLVDRGQVRPFDGDLDDYPAWLASGDPSGASLGAGRRATSPSAAEGNDRRQQRRQSAQSRQALQPLRQQERALEQRIQILTARRAEIEQALSEPRLYDAEGKTRLRELLEEQRRVTADLEAVESAWLDVNEAIEQAQAASS
jgi:ATP-binding cassette subfamily F protein 3